MRRRYTYVLMFAVPTFLLSAVGAAIAAGMAAGVLWLFVFGDSPWPAWTAAAIGGAGVLTVLVLWLAQLTIAFYVGRQQEQRGELNRRHVVAAVAATVVLAALIAMRLTGAGGGPASDSERCADYCSARGFAGSGMPPRNSGAATCTCYDPEGRPAATTTISSDAR